MLLEAYRRPRLIVLHPTSTAYEAARAMTDNHVGVILITEGHRLVGIVTDRDLTCEVIAAGFDPLVTFVADVMSEDVVWADIGSDVRAVVDIMAERGVRRVPLLERGKLVGLVSLDDLVLDGVIDTSMAAKVIRSQLEMAARYKPAGATHPEAQAQPEAVPRGARVFTRRAAHAAASYARLLKAAEEETLLSPERAELSLLIVLGLICRRITPDEALHFIAQLPSRLKAILSPHLDGPERRITRESLEGELAERLSVSTAGAAEIAAGVWRAVGRCISEGQIRTTSAQLPRDLQELFAPPLAPAA